MPNWSGKDDKLHASMSQVAVKNKAIVAVLRQTPNQPLFDDLTEDALISFTLHNFKKDGDYSCVTLSYGKSAVRAMDAVQEFSKKELNKPVNRFVVTGAKEAGPPGLPAQI